MGDCCRGLSDGSASPRPQDCTLPAVSSGNTAAGPAPFGWFTNMLANCLDFATKEHAAGRPIVGILCEFTPRELIMAAGAVPVCLCGGSATTISTAERDLPASLCPLIKSTYGYLLQHSNPFLEMADLVVAETTCDGKKKMYEIMAESRPMYVLELPQKPGDPDAFEHWYTELEKFRHALEQRFHVEITDERIRESIDLMNRERGLRRALAELMKAQRPALTGRQLLALRSSISAIPASLESLASIHAQLADEEGPASVSGKTRVLLTGVPMVTGAERVLDIIEECGGLVVCMENCTGLKPILEDVVSRPPPSGGRRPP